MPDEASNLHAALHDRLAADPVLAAMVGGSILDDWAPAGIRLPYLAILIPSPGDSEGVAEIDVYAYDRIPVDGHDPDPPGTIVRAILGAAVACLTATPIPMEGGTVTLTPQRELDPVKVGKHYRAYRSLDFVVSPPA